MTKTRILIATLFLLTPMGCDDGGGSNSYLTATYCPAVCQKFDDCDYSDGADDYNGCITDCSNGYEETLTDEYLEAYQTCITASTCENMVYADGGECRDTAQYVCTGNTAEAMTAYCIWMLECNNGTTPTESEINTCIADDDYLADSLSCMTPSARSYFTNCIADGECYETQIDECAYGL